MAVAHWRTSNINGWEGGISEFPLDFIPLKKQFKDFFFWFFETGFLCVTALVVLD